MEFLYRYAIWITRLDDHVLIEDEETPRFAPESVPDDNDTTSLGMQIIKYDDAVAHSILDQMLGWMNEDGIIDVSIPFLLQHFYAVFLYYHVLDVA